MAYSSTLRGDERAFAHLVRRYMRKAMAVALEYSGTREDAEDVVQDTFRRVLDGLEVLGHIQGTPFGMQWETALLGLSTAVVVGIVAGVAPARRAAALDSVQTLR